MKVSKAQLSCFAFTNSNLVPIAGRTRARSPVPSIRTRRHGRLRWSCRSNWRNYSPSWPSKPWRRGPTPHRLPPSPSPIPDHRRRKRAPFRAQKRAKRSPRTSRTRKRRRAWNQETTISQRGPARREPPAVVQWKSCKKPRAGSPDWHPWSAWEMSRWSAWPRDATRRSRPSSRWVPWFCGWRSPLRRAAWGAWRVRPPGRTRWWVASSSACSMIGPPWCPSRCSSPSRWVTRPHSRHFSQRILWPINLWHRWRWRARTITTAPANLCGDARPKLPNWSTRNSNWQPNPCLPHRASRLSGSEC